MVLERDFSQGYYDRFRDRLVFPISNVSGKFIAFGGRVLEESDEVKYINSPETPVYQKGKTLYGLFQNKGAIRKAGVAVIVEGYTDLLSLFQAGIENVVASLGTALTSHQARLLSRYAQEAIIVYDADSAGIAAAQRGLDLLLVAGISAKALSLPSGMDPDQVVREKGGDHLVKSLQNAQSFIDYKLSYLLQKVNFSSVEGKVEVIEEMGRTISLIDDPIKKGLYLKEVAEKMGVDDKLIALAMERASPRRRGKQVPQVRVGEGIPRKAELVERKLLALLLQNPNLISRVQMRLSPDDFNDENHSKLAQQLFAAGEKGSAEPAKLMNSIADMGLGSLISELCLSEEEGQIEQRLEDHVRYFEAKRLLKEMRKIKEQLQEAKKKGDQSLADRLTRRYTQIAQQRFQSSSSSP